MIKQSIAKSWLEHRLLRAWKIAFNIPDLTIDNTDFFEIGGTSLIFKRLQLKIRDIVDYELTAGTLFEHSNVISLAKKITAERNNVSCNHQLNHIVNMNVQSRKVPIYVCHGIHGDTFEWRFIASELGLNRYVYGLQDLSSWEITQRNGRMTMDELGEHHANAMYKLRDDDFYIAGYSVGAWVAYSTAIALEKKGAQNIKLYLFEPTVLPSLEGFFLSRKKLHQMGLNCKESGAKWVNSHEKSTVNYKNNQNKDLNNIDPTFQKTINYKPRPTRADITLALRKNKASSLKDYYIAAIAKKTPNIILFKNMKMHLDFRCELHSAEIARSMEVAFK